MEIRDSFSLQIIMRLKGLLRGHSKFKYCELQKCSLKGQKLSEDFFSLPLFRIICLYCIQKSLLEKEQQHRTDRSNKYLRSRHWVRIQ